MGKNVLLPLLLVFLLAVSFSSCGREQTSGLPMKVGRYYWPGMYWVEIADRKGWFKEAGLAVELIDTNHDYYASLQTMAAGGMDAHSCYLYDLMRLVAAGADLVMVVNTDMSFGSEGMAAKRSIDSVRKLRGKRIGLTRGTTLEFELHEVLSRNGLTLDDVEIVDMPAEKSVGEFVAGSVDAILAWEPLVGEAIAKGNGIKLFDTSEIQGISPAGYIFHKSFIDRRPGDVRAFLRVWRRTTEYISENPAESYGIIAGIYNKSIAEVGEFTRIDKILDLADNLLRFKHSQGFESLAGTSDRINRYMLKNRILEQELDHAKFLDGSFVTKLDNGLLP
ncbi:MAG: hypothetical protein ACD_75C00374G0011 [uncultured bacterium]|nr:MAG: hypothetical protein ACD_75C00374G0011 [uncultured bacterium]